MHPTVQHHLDWCRQSTYNLLAAQESPPVVVSSLLEKLHGHPETRDLPVVDLIVAARLSGGLQTREQIDALLLGNL